jgi:hypothetical protein
MSARRLLMSLGVLLCVVGFQVRAQASDLKSAWQLAVKDLVPDAPAITRTPLYGGLVEYSAVLPVGPGEHDRIGIHRVVREASPWHPIAAPRGIVLVHGSTATFRFEFLPGLVAPSFPLRDGLAPALAEAGIDVWGIDMRWSLVAPGVTSFDFMRSWDIAMEVRDVRVVTAIARTVRGLTGSGFGPLFYSGHSLGADVVYAYASDDATRPPALRDVRGLVPIDIIFKLTSPETRFLRDQAALRYQTYKQLYDSGVYGFDLAAQLLPAVALGINAPNDPSAIFPGFTNLQAATAIFSLSYLIYAPLPAYTPFYHFNSGTFDPVSGAPTGFQFIDQIPTLQFMLSSPPYQSLLEGVELDALISNAVDVPYDDHLAQVTAPIFYVGAAGGFGDFGLETLSLLGSTDKTSKIVRLLPPGNEVFDVGHIDIVSSRISRAEVWEPIRDWILAH